MKNDLLDVPGIGPVSQDRLKGLNIQRVNDLLWHFPRTYLQREVRSVAELRQEGPWVTVRGRIVGIDERSTRKRGLRIVEACLEDPTGQVDLIWFFYSRGSRRSFRVPVRVGQMVVASGDLRGRPGRFQLHNVLIDTQSIHADPPPWPVYKLTRGIREESLKRWIQWALKNRLPREWLDPSWLKNQGFPTFPEALRALHLPTHYGEIENARQRIALEELIQFYSRALKHRQRAASVGALACRSETIAPKDFYDELPFTPTEGQQRAIETIARELTSTRPMRRLLLGDVGTGKTVVAAYAALHVVQDGYQALLMAPTRILAEQHAQTLNRLLSSWNLSIGLLTTNTSTKERSRIVEGLRAGNPMLVVGTQSLLSEDVHFPRLALAVIDEEHRFGVKQREQVLVGRPIHFLAMSATPIPRTLASTIYIDLDVTFLSDKPAGRQKIDTRWIHPDRRSELYAFVRREVEKGRQAYVIFPRVDDDEDGHIRAVCKEAERLAANELTGIEVGVLHGRQSATEQEQSMDDFVKGKTEVLVATTVVEVGVDVPNATVIVIEHADQFGLAQLHQLRGRVGRGREQSYCLLVADPKTEQAVERIRALRNYDDGSKIAELDMELRGTGELFGLRQSGRWEFKTVDPIRDRKLFGLAEKIVRQGVSHSSRERDEAWCE